MILWACVILARAQSDVDSLNRLLEQARQQKNMQQEVLLLEKLIVRTLANDSLQMQPHYQRLQRLAKQQPNDYYIQASYAFVEGLLEAQAGRFEQARKAYQRAGDYFLILGDSLQAAHMQTYVGNVAYYMANYGKAASLYLEALSVFERYGDEAGIGRVYNNLANIFNEIGEYEQARQYLEKSLAIDEKYGNWAGVMISYNNLANAYRGLGQYDRALKLYKQYLQMAKQYQTHKGIGVVLRNMGEIYLLLQAYERADSCFRLGLAYEEAGNRNPVELADFYLNLGRLYYAQHQYAEALAYAQQALQQASQLSHSALMAEIYALLSGIYAHRQQYKAAWYASRHYDSLYKVLYSADQRADIFRLQLRYEEERNQKAQELRSRAEQLAQLKQKQKELLLILAAAVVLLLGVALWITYHRYRERGRLLRAIEQQKVQIQQQANEILEKKEELEAYQHIIEQQNQQLIQNNQLLESQIQQRTYELEHSYKQLLRAKNDLDSFLYRASHDLKGPIARISGLVNLGLHEFNDARVLEYFSRIMYAAREMDYILTRLMSIHDIISLQPQAELIDLKRLFEQVMQDADAAAYQPRLSWQLRLEPSLQLWADRRLLYTVFFHLVQNAINYCNGYNGAHIEVHAMQRGTRYAHIHFIDYGLGVEEQVQDQVFNLFVKGSRSKGAGLGLYIVQLATERLEGKIHLKQSRAGFTEFLLNLPLRPGYMQQALRESS